MKNEGELLQLNKGYFTKVDKADFDELAKYKWHVTLTKKNKAYVKRTISIKGKHTNLYLHRFLTNCPGGFEVDHDNGDTLDNRRANLLVVTPSQNNFRRLVKKKNCTSQYRGVCFNKKTNKWMARIEANYEKIRIGDFDNELEAALAYDKASLKYHGSHGRRNFHTDLTPVEKDEK